MVKVVSSPNCGNSPKMEFLKNFNIAFAQGNVEYLKEHVTDDIFWLITGEREIEGITAFAEALEEMKSTKVKELTLSQILSHGKEGAANGIITLNTGKKYAFSDFYRFQSAKGNKIKSITSYSIEV